jgi:excisionase family DNA binding protein
MSDRLLDAGQVAELLNVPSPPAFASSKAGSSKAPRARTIPTLALSPEHAAAALGVSRDYFDKWIAPELRVVRRGRRRLIAVRELDRWLDRAASLPLAEEL